MTKEEARLTLQDNFGYLTNEHPRIVEALKVALDKLSEDVLPSNLDEAVEEYANKEYPDEPCIGKWGTGDYEHPIDNEYPREIAKDAFKAGAKWMTEQGQTIKSLTWMDEDDNLFIEALVDKNKFKMADVVTIQVRKEE